MTDRDPYSPPGSPGQYDPPGTNPPRHQLSHHDASWSAAKVGSAILVVGLLAAGVFMWATNGGPDNSSASNAPAQTSGQGGARVNPGQDQNAPNPTPPRRKE